MIRNIKNVAFLALSAVFIFHIANAQTYPHPEKPGSTLGVISWSLNPGSLITQSPEVANPNSLYQLTCYADELTSENGYIALTVSAQHYTVLYTNTPSHPLQIMDVKPTPAATLDMTAQWVWPNQPLGHRGNIITLVCYYQAQP